MDDVRVLVVDDQELFRTAMSSVVDETDGFAFAGSASTGEEALAATERLRPDLVLLDVNLPDLDGVEVARRLAGEDAAPVVVLLSTYDEDQFDLGGCGAAAYVAKAAFGPERLSSTWHAAVDETGDGRLRERVRHDPDA